MKSSDLSFRGIKRLAIMGGTFDPIHLGHLMMAESVRINFNPEKVIFMPTGKSPHKESIYVSSDEHRYMMTVLATLNNPNFEVSKMEIDRPGVSYTVDTLNEIKSKCDPGTIIYFIVGADALCDMVGWKNARELFTLAEFITVPRPGFNNKKLKTAINDIYEFYGARMHYLETPAISISSTEIRSRIRTGNLEKYLLTEEVERYIIKNGLYRGKAVDPDKIEASIKDILSEKRFYHTIGVANEAVKLSDTYGLNPKKLYTAGLLHDCAKELSESKTAELIKKYKLKPDAFLKKSDELLHGILGAAIAEHEFGIEDEEVLNAIRNHTTGRPGMSRTEKVLFLADIIEPGRDDFEELCKIRTAAYTDIDKAVLYGLKMKINYLTEKKRKIHPISLDALDYYKKLKNDSNTEAKK